MLARGEKLNMYELSQAKFPRETPVFYMGPLLAGHISGIDEAMKRFSVQGVCGVGMSPPGEAVLSSLRRANYIPNLPLFYLQGGWAPKRVGWLKRRMVNMATRSMRRALQEKVGRTLEEQAQLDFLLQGGSFVAYENLDEIRAWLKRQAG
jgi:hypothetical protein